jgi:hypothetical protein
MNSINRDYYEARAAEHLRLAQQASTPNVAGLHLQLAKNYEELASINGAAENSGERRVVPPHPS